MHRESRDSEFVKSRLESGGATGVTRFKTSDGGGVIRVRVGERGRGLFAVSLIKKGEPIDNCGISFPNPAVLPRSKNRTG